MRAAAAESPTRRTSLSATGIGSASHAPQAEETSKRIYLSGALVCGVVSRLLQPRPVGVLVAMFQLFLQLTLLLGGLPRILGRGWGVEVDLLIHERSPLAVCNAPVRVSRIRRAET